MQARVWEWAVRGIVSLGIVACITLLYYSYVHVNSTTVALTLVLAILAVATWWGLTVASIMAVAAMLCFNYFFLPPIGTLTIADPQNWVALVAFLITAIVASNLSASARRQAQQALQATTRNGTPLRLAAGFCGRCRILLRPAFGPGIPRRGPSADFSRHAAQRHGGARNVFA